MTDDLRPRPWRTEYKEARALDPGEGRRCQTVDPEDGWQCPDPGVLRITYEILNDGFKGQTFDLDLCEEHADEQEIGETEHGVHP